MQDGQDELLLCNFLLWVYGSRNNDLAIAVGIPVQI
jgi:hypothetical protein